MQTARGRPEAAKYRAAEAVFDVQFAWAKLEVEATDVVAASVSLAN